MRLNTDELADLAYLEKQFVGNYDFFVGHEKRDGRVKVFGK
jgi:hypothetical protein